MWIHIPGGYKASLNWNVNTAKYQQHTMLPEDRSETLPPPFYKAEVSMLD